MPRKRSRIDTEQRFQNAVLDLVADSGCTNLGVNLVAERTGSDKVLIYRYFGDLEGLLERVAQSRPWLPSAEEILSKAGRRPEECLKHIFRAVYEHARDDAPSYQIARWRHAVKNPLTEKYSVEWKNLWKELAESVSREMPYKDRKSWVRALELLAMITQSKICGERVDTGWIDFLAEGLESAELEKGTPFEPEDILPTNLL